MLSLLQQAVDLIPAGLPFRLGRLPRIFKLGVLAVEADDAVVQPVDVEDKLLLCLFAQTLHLVIQ